MSAASAPSSHAFFATTPKGLESLLLAELAALGAAELRETRAGVAFHGPLALAYRACLWSRGAGSGRGAQGGTLADPLCGGGTLLVEGAMMAADIAPGLQREYYGFLAWRGHDATLWS